MRLRHHRDCRRSPLRRRPRGADRRQRARRRAGECERQREWDPECGSPDRGSVRAGRGHGLRSHPRESADPRRPRDRRSYRGGRSAPAARGRQLVARRPHAPRRGFDSDAHGQGLRERDDRQARERLQGPPLHEVRGLRGLAGRAGTPRVRVRMARLEDAPGLVPLFETFYGAFFGGRVTETAVAGRLRLAAPHESVIVAEVDDRLTGFASLRVTDSLDPDPYAELADLFVEPESRRLGVASRLVKYAEGIAREHGASHIVVLTGQKNTEALAFYRSAGYEEFATAMRKPLKLAESQ